MKEKGKKLEWKGDLSEHDEILTPVKEKEKIGRVSVCSIALREF